MKKALPIITLLEIVYLLSSFYLAERYGQWSYQGEILRSMLRIISIIILIFYSRRYLRTDNAKLNSLSIRRPIFITAVLLLWVFAAFFSNAGNETDTWQSVFFASGLLAGFREELFYRGIVQTALLVKFNYRTALLLASLIFTLAHIQYFYYQQYFAILLILLAGIIFGSIYIYTGSVYITGAIHALYDAILSLNLSSVKLSNSAGLTVLLVLAAWFMVTINNQLRGKNQTNGL